ncbi:MAG: phosphonoacetaldehyde hydrolase [Oceanospirillaceae bacterium]
MLQSTAKINQQITQSDESTSSIEAVIMDWAGTTVDFGSLAPIKGFQKLFASYQIAITEEETRIPMGTEKREHIRQLLDMARIKQAWNDCYSRSVTDQDINEMYAAFIPLQKVAISESSTLIPGLLDTLSWLDKNAIKIGANTGYSEEMISELLITAKQQGYHPQSNVCATQVTKGRPYPYMCMTNAMQLGVKTLANCVKIDDTIPGIEEGINAGMWTIGLSVSGNEVGMNLAQWQQLEKTAQHAYRIKATKKLQDVGADYVVDSIANIIPCLQDIEKRLLLGERP